MRAKGSKNPNAGRPKGSQNKSTVEIRDLVQSLVNFPRLIKALERRAYKKNDIAARLLFEYGYGRVREQPGEGTGLTNDELQRLREIAHRQMVSDT